LPENSAHCCTSALLADQESGLRHKTGRRRHRPGEGNSAPYRYVWPSELDLMARIAGLRLRDRWSGWDRAPFTSDSQSQVAVFEKNA